MTTHSSILAWEILWIEEPGGLQSMGLQKGWTPLNDWTTPILVYPKDEIYFSKIQYSFGKINTLFDETLQNWPLNIISAAFLSLFFWSFFFFRPQQFLDKLSDFTT